MPLRSLAALLPLALLSGACDRHEAREPHGGEPRELVVLAAASLGPVLFELGPRYEAHSGQPIRLSIAGSQTLAMQVREGIRCDVIATADRATMDSLVARGLVATPRVLARNRLVWIERAGLADEVSSAVIGPARLSSPERLRLVLAAPEVPAGRYAREALARLGLLESAHARLVSNELDVRGVLAKVRLGEADAGIVYATDLPPGAPGVTVVELPARAQVVADYPIARVRAARSPAAADELIAWLTSADTRAVFGRAGFAPGDPAPDAAGRGADAELGDREP